MLLLVLEELGMTMRQGCLVGNTGEFLHTALGGGGKQDVWHVSNTQLLVKSKKPLSWTLCGKTKDVREAWPSQ